MGVVVARRPRAALAFGLELWTAAALLRLSGPTPWVVVAGAATVVAIRLLATRTLLSPR